jgi:lipopolysaccharide export system permease protein
MLMRRITRYIIFEMMKVFLTTLFVMTSIMLLIGLAQRALREGMGPIPVLRLIPFVLPDALRFAIPGTLLFATCSLYGRMSADNEILAVKAMGISPMVVIWPALVLGFTISLAAVWLNDIAVTWGRHGINRVVLQSVEEIAYGMLRTQQSYTTDRFSISVKGVQDRTLIRPTICFHATDQSPTITLVARQAELNFNPENNKLKIRIEDTEFDVGTHTHGQWPNTFEYELPIPTGSRGGINSRSPSEIALRNITSKAQQQRKTISRQEQLLAAHGAYQMLTGDFQQLTSKQWENRTDNLDSANFRLFRLLTEPWRRWANGFSCLVFILIGTGMAIRLRTADFWTSFGLCFLPILAIYYPLMQYGVDRAKCGAFPPYSVWFGNLVLLVIGTILLRRAIRH